MSISFDVFGDHPHPVVHDLEKPAAKGKTGDTVGATDRQRPLAQQRHERGMVRQDADLAVEGGRDDCVRFTVELDGWEYRDLHHSYQLLGFSTASSIPPTM
jgi:hypothetical protein